MPDLPAFKVLPWNGDATDIPEQWRSRLLLVGRAKAPSMLPKPLNEEAGLALIAKGDWESLFVKGIPGFRMVLFATGSALLAASGMRTERERTSIFDVWDRAHKLRNFSPAAAAARHSLATMPLSSHPDRTVLAETGSALLMLEFQGLMDFAKRSASNDVELDLAWFRSLCIAAGLIHHLAIADDFMRARYAKKRGLQGLLHEGALRTNVKRESK